MTGTTDTERAIRAITCEGCREGWLFDEVVARDVHRKPSKFVGDSPDGFIPYACTSLHRELLPLFQSATERAVAPWKKALEELTPSGSEFVNDPIRCAAYVTDGLSRLRETIKNLVKRRDDAINGAYAAAANEAGRVQVLPPDAAQRTIRETILDIKKRILALTPADARQAHHND